MKDIFANAVEEANSAQYCINCDHAYLREEDGNGYCKFQRDDSHYHGGYLKPIHEYAFCDHWKKKE